MQLPSDEDGETVMVKKLEWQKQTVEIKDIKRLEYALISDFDEQIDLHFIESVRENGVLEPIKIIKTNDGTLYLVDGFHRLRETEKQGRSEIEAFVAEGSLGDAYDWNVLSNVLRGKMNPVHLAYLIDYKMVHEKLSQEEIAKQWHISKSYISKLLAITRHRGAREGYLKGQLSFEDAYQFSQKAGPNDKPIVIDESTDEEYTETGDEETEYDSARCLVCSQFVLRKQRAYLTIHKNCVPSLISLLSQPKKVNKKHV